MKKIRTWHDYAIGCVVLFICLLIGWGIILNQDKADITEGEVQMQDTANGKMPNVYNSKFGVRVYKDRYYWYLSITRNGYQWTSIPLENPIQEAPEIIKTLSDAFPKFVNEPIPNRDESERETEKKGAPAMSDTIATKSSRTKK